MKTTKTYTAAQAHTFDWPGAIARNCDTLLRIVTVPFIYAGLDEGRTDAVPALPHDAPSCPGVGAAGKPPAVRAGVRSRIQTPVLVQKRTARM